MSKIFSEIKRDVSGNQTVTNEGAVVTCVLYLLVTIGMMLVTTVMNIRIQKRNEGKIRELVNAYANKYKETKEFKNKIHHIDQVDIDDLAKAKVLEEKDAKLCKYNDMVAYAIYDKNNFILAYALFSFSYSTDIVNYYAIRICDKSIRHTPELAFFIKATFELKIMFYGPGLRKILGGKFEGVYDNDLAYTDIVDNNGYAKSKPMSITVDEFNNIADDMETIINKISYAMRETALKNKQLFTGSTCRVNSADTFKNAFRKGISVQPYMYAYIDFNGSKVRSLSNHDFIEYLTSAMKDICNSIRKEGFEITLEPGTDTYWMSGAQTRSKANEDHPYFTIVLYINNGRVFTYITSNRTFRLG